MYEKLVRLLKDKAERFNYDGWVDTAVVMEQAADAIEELNRNQEQNAQERPKWISVKECLPDEGIPVLAWEAQGFYYVDHINKGVWEIAENNCGSVTHWMPVPEPPEEDL